MSTEQIDVRDYAATRGISTEEAAKELGEEYAGEGETVQPGHTGLQAGSTPAPSATIGHNQGPAWAAPSAANLTSGDASALTTAARDKLRQIVARVERLEEEKKEVAGQIKDVYDEGKSMGYDVSALRAMVRERKMDRQEREEREAILDVYRQALEGYD